MVLAVVVGWFALSALLGLAYARGWWGMKWNDE